MSLQVILSDDALDELQDTFDWYEHQRPGLGTRFMEAVQNRLDILELHPKRFPIVYLDVREADVIGFPYCLYYTIASTSIGVLAVFHTSRDPNVWKRRRRNTP